MKCRLRVAGTVAAFVAMSGPLAAPLNASAQPAPVAAVAPLQLGYDAAANLGFERQVHDVIRQMQAEGAGLLCLPLLADQPAGSATKAADSRAEWADCGSGTSPSANATFHVLMLRDGAFWRFASSYEPGIDKPLGLGSVSKAVLALPMLALTGARDDEWWCDHQGARRVGGEARGAGPEEQDDLGSTAAEDMAVRATTVAVCPTASRISPQAAFAASRNAALIERMRQIPADLIRDNLATAQLQGATTIRHPAVAVPLGLVELTPRQAVECFDALATGQARRAALLRNAIAEPSAMARWCAQAVADPQRRSYVHTMLVAPGATGGTAAYATQSLPPAPKGTPAPLAKTGTPSDATRKDLGKTLLLSFEVGTHRYTVLIALVSPSPVMPMARRLPGDFLRPLVRLVGQHALP